MTIRSLLEHVGAIERGQRIFVGDKEVDRPSWFDRLHFRISKIRDRMYEWMIKENWP
jgi:repressor of nif and glnA expression